MTAIEHRRANELRRVPWKNGRGTTLEVASDASEGQPWTWRVSIADVPESGPFSRFDGIDRQIACVAGRGMDLIIDGGEPHRVPDAGRALAFAGEAATIGRLVDGPVRDANLMLLRGRWVGTLDVLRDGARCGTPATAIRVVVAVEGSAVVEVDSERVALAEGDAVVLRVPAPDATVTAGGRTVVAAIRSAVA